MDQESSLVASPGKWVRLTAVSLARIVLKSLPGDSLPFIMNKENHKIYK